jgi:hypothetical protein
MSQIQFPLAGFLDARLIVVNPWESTADGLFGYLDHLLDQEIVVRRAGRDLVERVRPISGQAHRWLFSLSLPPCLMHGDFKASNLLIDAGKLSGILDWEFVSSGTWLMGAGQLFRHPLPAGFEEAFSEGFVAGGGELFEGWRSLARAIDLLSAFDFLGRESCSAERQAGVIALAWETVRAWQNEPII